MSDSNLFNKENATASFNGFRSQLANILGAYQNDQDDALLNGFLSFVHSKAENCIQVSVRENVCSRVSSTENEEENNDEIRRGVDGESVLGEIDLSVLLDCIWKSVHYPIFKFFQSWRQALVPVNVKASSKFVEFRKMNAKLTRVFKCIHKFYYSILETLFNSFDSSLVVPNDVVKMLNIKVENVKDKALLEPENALTVVVVVLIHKSLVYLGSCHRYKQSCEKVSNHYEIQDFKKSQRYYHFASLVLPSVGESHLQKGLIYVQTKNYGYSTYSFMRSILSRLPSSAGLPNFINTICESRSKSFQQIAEILEDLKRHETDKKRIINSEIIEMYFLVLFGAHIAPTVWKSKEDSLAFNGIRLSHYKQLLFERTETRYVKNVSLIMQNLILLIGGFDILLLLDNDDKKKCNIQDLNPQQVEYLSFCCEFMSHLINNVIMNEWDGFEDSKYLAMVRIIICWLKCNKIALQFAHRAVNLCSALARLINAMLKSQLVDSAALPDHRPKRSYFFEEDVMLKEFKTVKFVLTDFKDDEIYRMEDVSERLAGIPKDKLSLKEENLLRIEAIAVSGKKFLMKNSCNVKWSQDQFIQIPKKKTGEKLKKWGRENVSKLGTSNTVNGKKAISVRELEAQLQEQNKTVNRGYSGSSVPVAPAGFNVKPSTSFTDIQSDVSTTTSRSSLAQSPFLPPSANASPYMSAEQNNCMQYWAHAYQSGIAYNGVMMPVSQMSTIQSPPPPPPPGLSIRQSPFNCQNDENNAQVAECVYLQQ